jgi:hypothetical protein
LGWCLGDSRVARAQAVTDEDPSAPCRAHPLCNAQAVWVLLVLPRFQWRFELLGETMSAKGDAVAGAPRRVQHGIPRPEMVRDYPRKDSGVAVVVRGWLDRQRMTPAGLTPVEIAVLERCIEDLR